MFRTKQREQGCRSRPRIRGKHSLDTLRGAAENLQGDLELADDTLVVETRALKRHFGRIRAVDGVDLAVRAGETYGLLGPNGSGKTTLIRLLVGLLRPTAGEARVLGKPMPNKEVLSRVGYMTQADALYQDLTVWENLLFFGRVYGVSSRSRLRELLELVELPDRADSVVATLSGGMRRRASLACALVHNPVLLFLDEPTVGIDPQLRMSFWQHFYRLNQQGVSIIVSSHVMDEAEHCHRLGLMREGHILAEGSAEELRQHSGTSTLEEAFLSYIGGGSGLG
jgi:ABC-2 type transport system ATP-binding protein